MKVSYKLTDGRKVVLKVLTTDEVTHYMSAVSNPAKAVETMAKLMLVKVGEVQVTADNRDEVWSKLTPKDVSLIIEAFNKWHFPTQEERTDFFASETIEVET
jgi:hypothetical protein